MVGFASAHIPAHAAWIAGLTSTLLAGILLAGLSSIVAWAHVGLWIAPLVAFHCVAGVYFRKRVNEMSDYLRALRFETGVLREGLRLVESEQFQSTKLQRLAASACDGAVSLRKLERLVNALDQRNKEWFYGPSLLLLAGTQISMAIERWRRNYEERLRTWLRAWSEFEALNALASYAFENPENTFPEFTGETCFTAAELGHPLLPREACVVNDVELTAAHPFYVVSGSNMSGKSTLLGSIGLNAVLAFAGAPVRAGTLRISPLSIVASISVNDSLRSGKSRFLAEVERLRQAMGLTQGANPVLFLVDEIFGGTNSGDRRSAAEAVIRALLGQGAIGAFSTHDLALTEIAAATGLSGSNVHMGSREGGGPLDFDYRLKPGIANETNALAIARMAGVPV